MKPTILFRGHKDEDYLKTRFSCVSFAENLAFAALYGLGQNDAGNPDVRDGFVTTERCQS